MVQSLGARIDAISRLLVHNAIYFKSRPSRRHKDCRIRQTWLGGQVLEAVRAHAVGLHRPGFKRGETIAIVGTNRQSLKAKGADGRPIIYGIRLEHFQLSADRQPSTVSLIEPSGSETQLTPRFVGVPIICAFCERGRGTTGRDRPYHGRSSERASVRRRQSPVDDGRLTGRITSK